MPALTKTQKFESLAKILQRRYKTLAAPPEREMIEHLVYAAFLENAPSASADVAMTVLASYFIDWNEIRVSTVSELADVFSMLPDPKAAGERIRKTLQSVFDKKYSFDLEDLRKKGTNLSHTVGFLESLSVCSRFMIDYTTQVALGGHVIPLDEAALRIFRLLGLAQVNKDGTREDVPGIERGIPKKNGVLFATQLHCLATEFYNDPDSAELRKILKAVDPDALTRSWIPPVLTVPKPVPVEPKPKMPPVAALPVAASDDDDFEEAPIGTEAEFIPDADSATELPVQRGGTPLPDLAEQEIKAKKSEKSKPTASPTKASPTQKVPEKKAAEPKDSATKTKKAETPKNEVPKVEAPQKSAVKSEPQQKEPLKKGAANTDRTPSKSPTKQLRQKKPK